MVTAHRPVTAPVGDGYPRLDIPEPVTPAGGMRLDDRPPETVLADQRSESDREGTAKDRPLPNDTPTLLKMLIAEVVKLRESTVEPPAGNREGAAAFIRVVTVATVGTAVQGPDIPVPKGYACTVRQSYHATDRTGYVAFSKAEVGNSGYRVQLRNRDSVDFRGVRNMAELWFDADTASTVFEVIAES